MSLSSQPADLLHRARQVVVDASAAVLSAADSIDQRFVAVAQLLLGRSGKILITGSGTSCAIAIRNTERRCLPILKPTDDSQHRHDSIEHPAPVFSAQST